MKKAERIGNDQLCLFLSVYVTKQGEIFRYYFYCIFGWFGRQILCGAKNFRNENERWFRSDQIFISVRYPPSKNLTITYGVRIIFTHWMIACGLLKISIMWREKLSIIKSNTVLNWTLNSFVACQSFLYRPMSKGSYTNHVATKGEGGSSKNHNTT